MRSPGMASSSPHRGWRRLSRGPKSSSTPEQPSRRPTTGSAAGPLGGYLVYHDATRVEPTDGVYKFVIEQGDFINRPSRIGLEVKGAPGNVEEVRVGGQSVVVATGVLEF